MRIWCIPVLSLSGNGNTLEMEIRAHLVGGLCAVHVVVNLTFHECYDEFHSLLHDRRASTRSLVGDAGAPVSLNG